ncbi:hypothetical protein [Halostella pelagica]|uniref:hypothetical protein n=1 Tax=Halostella pelagica TaxID=2583824 RepID=UPI0010814A57|nr:hypothetical protein [Halostella pelagica]
MTQPETLDDRLREGDEPLVSAGSHTVTFNEVHAGVLGAALGLALTWSPIARRTIRREPWYAAGALLCGYWTGRRSR